MSDINSMQRIIQKSKLIAYELWPLVLIPLSLE